MDALKEDNACMGKEKVLSHSHHLVFISYSNSDRLISEAICHRLEEENIPCWIAPRDVIPGERFEGQIVRAIRDCQIMVLVFSPRSNASEHVANEIAQACKSNKTIIPFVVEETEISEDLDYYLSSKHWLVAYPDYREKTADLVETVFRLLGRESNIPKAHVLEMTPPEPMPISGAEIHFDTDVDCIVYRFKEKILDAKKGEDNVAYLKKGKHRITITSKLFNEIEEQITLDIPSLDYSDIVVVRLCQKELELTPLRLIEQDGKFGYIDPIGQIRIPIKYDYALRFSEGVAWVKESGKWQCIDKSGNTVFPTKYDDVKPFCGGIAPVGIDAKFGFINKNGKTIIPLRYDKVLSFSEGLACVCIDGKFGFVDQTGSEIISLMYDRASSFHEGLAVVGKGDKYGVIDKRGKQIIPFEYDSIEDFTEGFASVRKNKYVCYHFISRTIISTERDNGSSFVIDKAGKVVIPPDYLDIGSFSEGLALASKRVYVGSGVTRHYGFIDKSGHVIIPFCYNNVHAFRDGLAYVSKDGKKGYIDKTGNVIIPLLYESPPSAFGEHIFYHGTPRFSEGLVCLRKDGKCGYVNREGKVIIPFIFDDAGPFELNYAHVMKDGKWFYINRQGEKQHFK